MENNSSETNGRKFTPPQLILFFFGLMALLVGLVYYAVALMALALLVALGSITAGVFLILRSYATGDAKSQAISNEIELMSNDASFDISEELITWDKLKYTKGIGTRMEGQDRDIEDIHHRLVIARDELTQATTPVHRIEAVLSADSVLAIAQELRKPAQS
ncbi:hypothetical protein ACX9MK_06755 [Corynebacterium evansiae]